MRSQKKKKRKKRSGTELSCEVSCGQLVSPIILNCESLFFCICLFCFLVAVEAANEGRRGFMVGSVFLPSNTLYIFMYIL